MGINLQDSCIFASEKLQDCLIAAMESVKYAYSMNDTAAESGRRIRAARKRIGLKLREVCAQVPGLEPNKLSNWEHGRHLISVDDAKRLAPVLGVTASYLLTVEDGFPDPREKALIECYRKTDERGKTQISRLAEAESLYSLKGDANCQDAHAA